jgi:hypothetical protein
LSGVVKALCRTGRDAVSKALCVAADTASMGTTLFRYLTKPSVHAAYQSSFMGKKEHT